MRQSVMVLWTVALVMGLLPHSAAAAQTTAGTVFYHDQSGTSLHDIPAAQALRLASQRIGFAVRVAATAPAGSRLRALWVMDKMGTRFVVIYYGGDDGSITTQIHESLHGTGVVLHWAQPTPITIGPAQGLLRQSPIGGAYPVSELVWRAHGIRYDLLGSVSTSLDTLLHMAASL